jgi:hypothetical protein
MDLALTNVDDLAVFQTRCVLDQGEVRHAAHVRQHAEHHERQRQQARPVELPRHVAFGGVHVNTVPDEQQLRL